MASSMNAPEILTTLREAAELAERFRGHGFADFTVVLHGEQAGLVEEVALPAGVEVKAQPAGRGDEASFTIVSAYPVQGSDVHVQSNRRGGPQK